MSSLHASVVSLACLASSAGFGVIRGETNFLLYVLEGGLIRGPLETKIKQGRT